MGRIINQGLIIVALFLSIWLSLSEVNWLQVLRLPQATRHMEQELGKLLWNIFKREHPEIENQLVTETVDSLLNRLCDANEIDRERIRLHILKADEVNAFALPDGHLVVYTALIREARNEAELMGVIAHEMAHIELNHVMKKLVKETGMSMLAAMVTGGGGSETVAETAKVLSSTAFDRGQEREADLTAADYLINADIDPTPFAGFLRRLSKSKNKQLERYFSWISTHPDPEERADYLLEYMEGRAPAKGEVLSSATWAALQETLRSTGDAKQ